MSGPVMPLVFAALAVGVWPAGPARERVRLVVGAPTARGRLGRLRQLPETVLAPAGAALVALLTAGPLHAAAAALIAGTAAELRRRSHLWRDRRSELEAWERALDDAASALRAGVGPAEALGRAADSAGGTGSGTGADIAPVPVEGLLRAAHAHARLGGDVAAALWASGDPAARDLAGAWRLATRHGVPLATVVDGLREDVADRRERSIRVEAVLSGPRATAVILTGLPLFGVVMGSGFGADPLSVLLTGPLGGALCLAGAVFLSAGLLWTAGIADGARS